MLCSSGLLISLTQLEPSAHRMSGVVYHRTANASSSSPSENDPLLASEDLSTATPKKYVSVNVLAIGSADGADLDDVYRMFRSPDI